MLKVVLIGAGKMGISHLSILGAHAEVEVTGVCDTSKMVNDFLTRYGKFNCFTDYQKMLSQVEADAAFVAVPTKFHYPIIKDLLQKGLHVFAEKPFCLTVEQGEELVKLAATQKRVTQVGYHNKFVGTFREVKKLVDSGAIGDIYHFTGEAYGPVVTRKKQDTWRSDPGEGGGCLLDYASHVIDLLNGILSPVVASKGTLLKSVYSNQVEDAVYSLLELKSGVSGVLQVNWSDETHRKMTTSVTLMGTRGKIISDANELKVFLKGPEFPEGYTKGWNIKYITELTAEVDFYLRGEEYSAQVDHFVKACLGKVPNDTNTFESAWLTDRAISIIKQSSK